MPPIREARWTNPSQPQTLQIAVFLLYFQVAFFVLDLLRGVNYLAADAFPWGPLLALSALGALLAGRGIASEAKWGYVIGIVVAFAPMILRVLITGSANAALSNDLINLMFEIALIALLLHPMSREYQRVWFK
jgi:hypothetical protein